MYCSKCGALLSNEEKFCSNCGNYVEVKQDNLNNIQNVDNNISDNYQMYSNNVNSNISNNNPKKEKDFGLYSLICGICSIVCVGVFGIILGIISIFLRKKEEVKTSKGKIGKILGIVGIVLSVIYLIGDVLLFKSIFDYGSSNSKNDYVEQNNYDNNNDLTNESDTISVKGNYSREVFSGHSFDYVTSYDTAVLTFNKDSTFEVAYKDGATYKGVYEVYNGFYINVKAEEIKGDTSISNNELLASDINDVANKMMATNLLNTYLLWLKTDDNILQPFMISYNEDTNTGDIVNVFARVQGKLTLK